MKKQNKLSLKVRDLEPLKDVTAGRRRHAHARFERERDRDPRDPRGGYGIHMVQ